IGPEAAAGLYRVFLREIERRLAGDPRWRFFWAFEPAEAPFTREIAPGREGFPQVDGDLGRRMAGAMAEAFRRGASRVSLIGSDLPHLPPARIAEALRRLDCADLVLGPSHDGGYYLIAARTVPPVFGGVPWGTPVVLERTLAAARREGLSVDLLPATYDLDSLADLKTLLDDPASFEIPETRRSIVELVGHRGLSGQA
ncbi:MAG: TIGR04282 family arsenosugar biosynthesis glycosyltransferase, partial [Candidatus Binatia bacterium]